MGQSCLDPMEQGACSWGQNQESFPPPTTLGAPQFYSCGTLCPVGRGWLHAVALCVPAPWHGDPWGLLSWDARGVPLAPARATHQRGAPAPDQPLSLLCPGTAAAPSPPMAPSPALTAPRWHGAAEAAVLQTFCLHGDFPSPHGAAGLKPKTGLFGCLSRLWADCSSLFPLGIIYPGL